MFRPLFSRLNLTIGEENDLGYIFTKGNKVYTEDNVLVYNILVYDIPIWLTEGDVRHYFSKFGIVLDVKLAADKTKSRRVAFKKALVKFAEPESAFSVLRKKNRLHGLHIRVRAGDSWDQPNADKACDPKKNEDDVASTSKGTSKEPTTTNGGTHMLSLNDYCIEAIFDCLNLKEKVRFARVCERFRDIFQMYYRRQSKYFGLNNISELTLWEIRDFFRFAGGNITSITGTVPYKNRERIVEFIQQYCGKLKRIRLTNTDLRIEFLDELLRGYPQLKELTLRKCSLNDKSVQTMTFLNRMETLDLAQNVQLTGKFISNLVQLKELNLFGCCNIKLSNLLDISKSLTNLRSLDIRLVGRLPARFFDVMVEHCKNLETLKMCCDCFRCERVALLPRLKQLGVVCFSFRSRALTGLLAELVTHKADQLDVLKIVAINELKIEHFELISDMRQLKTLFVPCNLFVNNDALMMFCKLQQLEELTIQGCKNITNNDLLKLVKSCLRLRRLDIQFCTRITTEFLLEAIVFLKASEKRKQPLVILVHGIALVDCDDTVYEELKEAAKQHLISVIFEASGVVLGSEAGIDIYA